MVIPPEVVIPPSCATGGGLPPAVRHPQKKHVLDLLSMYLVNLVNFHRFEALLVFFSESGQSDQMTMPARRASKFSAKRRAVLPHMFFLRLIS